MDFADAHSNGTLVDGGQVFLIPVQFIAELQEKVGKLNKKASKLGTPPITLTLTDEIVTKEVKVGGSIARQTGPRLTYQARYVILKGSTPVIEGWQFVAVIRHQRTGNEFVRMPQAFAHLADENETTLSHYVFADKVCDHCNLKRVRNATYLLMNEEGEFKQVGSACLGDFTGYNNPQAAARAFENIFKMFHTFEQYERQVPRTTKVFMLAEWMAFVARQVREDGGFVSRFVAGPNSTADQAKINILNYVQDPNATVVPNDADWHKAWEIISWVRSTDDQGEFMVKLRAAMEHNDDLREEDMGITAAAFKAMEKAQIEERKLRNQSVQEFFGIPGQRIDARLTVERVGNAYNGGYGVCYAHTLVDAEGHKFMMWYKKQLGVGESYNVRATVKDHKVNNYTGDKETVINRPKMEVVA
jgi:hypothetical protein